MMKIGARVFMDIVWSFLAKFQVVEKIQIHGNGDSNPIIPLSAILNIEDQSLNGNENGIQGDWSNDI